MYYANNPGVIELADDILGIEEASFVPADDENDARITLTFVLRSHKAYDTNNLSIHLTNGVNHQVFPLAREDSTVIDSSLAETSDNDTVDESPYIGRDLSTPNDEEVVTKSKGSKASKKSAHDEEANT